MIVYMDRASIESLTVKDIREIVVKQSYQMKYQKLERYYVGIMTSCIQRERIRPEVTTGLSITWPATSPTRPRAISGTAGGVQLRERGISADHSGYLRL